MNWLKNWLQKPNKPEKKIWIKPPCNHRDHNFPSHLYIPPGQTYTHTCPGCGQTISVTGRQDRLLG